METEGRGAPGPHPVAAGLLVHRGRVLLCHRSAEREWYPAVWDLPGGHIEVGEAPPAALVRELREELDIVIEEPTATPSARVTTQEFDMQVWVIEEWTGTPTNATPDEHDAVRWFAADEVSGLPLAHASYLPLLSDALRGSAGGAPSEEPPR